MQLPAIIYKPSGQYQIVDYPVSVTYGEGEQAILHPADVWALWTPTHWRIMCPDWRIYPLTENPAADAGMKAVKKPVEDWIIHDTYVEVTYDQVALTAAEIEAQNAVDRLSKVREIDVERDRRLALGALYRGKRFSMSDTSRTDLGGMATTAGLVLSRVLPAWPDSYAQGWIAIDNTRLALPTPADGVSLAAAVALAYSDLVQHARDLKDAVLTADDPATVDELSGWPD